MTKRVCFLVDGFNVYHSLRQIEAEIGRRVRWLDLHRLLGSHLHTVRQALGEPVETTRIYYFSALATHLTTVDRGVVDRHRVYIAALESTGVTVVLHRFKAKEVLCPRCRARFKRHEEKETDVAIGVKLIEVLARDEGDTAVLVTGDSDVMPALRTAKALFPSKKVGIGFPYNRRTAELEHHADFSFNLRQRDVERSQFPSIVRLADGTEVTRPPTW